MKRRPGMLLLLSLIAVCPQRLRATEPRELNEVEKSEIKLLFEDELWRPGGPRQDRVVALVREGIRSGNLYVFLEMDQHIQQFWRRRLFDPRSLAPLLREIGLLSVKGTYFENRPDFVTAAAREGITLWNLSARERHDLYEYAIRHEKGTERNIDGERVGFTWQTASIYALQEELDDLVLPIDLALQQRKGMDRGARDLEEAIDQEYLPLARARRSRDWIGGYLEIVRQDTGNDITARTQQRLIAERRTREALLRLVVKNRRDALPALDEDWEPVRSKEITPYDDGYHRWAEIATTLLRANRALGSRAIDEKVVRKLIAEKPEDAERSLRKRGLLRTAEQ
ncbi:MAG: hypothetical protein WCC53_02485 [Thermoanaerobaculia bacterium]